MFLHVGFAQVNKGFRQVGIELGGFSELYDGGVQPPLFARVESLAEMLRCVRRRALQSQPKEQDCVDHGFSGSRISRN